MSTVYECMLATTPVDPSVKAAHTHSTPCTAAVQTFEMRLGLKLTPPGHEGPYTYSEACTRKPVPRSSTGVRTNARPLGPATLPLTGGERHSSDSSDDNLEVEGQADRKRTRTRGGPPQR